MISDDIYKTKISKSEIPKTEWYYFYKSVADIGVYNPQHKNAR